MAWLFLLAALLGLMFPPIGVVILAMVVLGVFTKGVAADSQDPIGIARRKVRHRSRARRRREQLSQRAAEPSVGEIIDVRSYPVLHPVRLPGNQW